MRTPVLPADALDGGLAFHRLGFIRRRTAWWTPLMVGLVGVVIYVVMLGWAVVALVALGTVSPAVSAALVALESGQLFDRSNPLVVLLALATIAFMLPAYLLASRLVQGPRLGYVSSAAGRLRGKWLLICVALALGVDVVIMSLGSLLPLSETAGTAAALPDPGVLALGVLAVLLVVPVQAAAEEYVFRGYLMQAVGRWLRHPVFAILLPVPLFVLGHGYDPVGQAGVGVFALAAGWLSWRTGGLEAAIGVHVVNNLGAFLLAVFGLVDPNASVVGWESLLVSVAFLAAYAAVVELVLRRLRLGRVVLVTPPTSVAPLLGVHPLEG